MEWLQQFMTIQYAGLEREGVDSAVFKLLGCESSTLSERLRSREADWPSAHESREVEIP